MLLKKLKKNKARIYILKIRNSNNIRNKKYLFLKKILSKFYNINIDIDNMNYNSYGKPILSSIQFNCSDTSQYIAIIIGKKAVGIDIENKRKVDKVMIDKILDKKEQTKKLDDSYLLKHWVGKEAYVKYLGTGIIEDFRNLNLKDIQKKNYCYKKSTKKYILYAFATEKISRKIIYIDEKEIFKG